RARDEVTRDLQALLHSARENTRTVINPAGVDFDLCQPILSGFAQLTIMAGAQRPEPPPHNPARTDIQTHALAPALMDKGQVAPHEKTPRGLGKRVNIRSVARIGPVSDCSLIGRQPAREAM